MLQQEELLEHDPMARARNRDSAGRQSRDVTPCNVHGAR